MGPAGKQGGAIDGPGAFFSYRWQLLHGKIVPAGKSVDVAALKGAVIAADSFIMMKLGILLRQIRWCKWALNNNT